VVDDESDVIFTLKIVLEENGFKVDSFTDPLVALENFRGKLVKYDIILLDIKMPEMNGFELYRHIKKIDDKAKVCFLTAGEMYYGVYTDIFNSLDAEYFIRKPIDNEELVKRVNNMISS
jgi:DNA-binding response OmpR family regulator